MLTNNPHGFQNSCFWDWPIRFPQDDCYCDETSFQKPRKLQPRTINYPSISTLTKRTSERNCYRNCATLISKVPTISFMISLFYLSLDQHPLPFCKQKYIRENHLKKRVLPLKGATKLYFMYHSRVAISVRHCVKRRSYFWSVFGHFTQCGFI